MRKVLAVLALAIAGVLLTPAVAGATFGIDPGKVYIDNLYPGANGEYRITIFNQNNEKATFSIAARQPDYTQQDYETFAYLDWISIKPGRLTIAAKGKADVVVTVTMPKGATYFGKKAEAWISFKELDTPGMIKVELASRLFISTKAESKGVSSSQEGGSVGISAEAVTPTPSISPATTSGVETVTPAPSTAPEIPSGVETSTASLPSSVIAGSVAGAVIAGGVGLLLMRKRRHAKPSMN
ncbi:MAG: hypothetical protein HYX79_07340 [Chloroflexi bacterium]|nr:hypothetical protein [Chloroflexota bacterium]